MSCASAANLLAKYRIVGALCPPRLRVDGAAVLLEFDVQGGIAVGPGWARTLLAHVADRFAREHELADLDADLIHPREQKIVAVARVDDQELAIGPKRTRELH